MSKFGEALARYRNEAGLNQRQLGAAIGLDSTQVNKIERGHRPPLGAKYMKPLVCALRLNQNDALNLVQLADLSPKVLELQDEVQTPVHPRILRKKDVQAVAQPTPSWPQPAIAGAGVLGAGVGLDAILPRSRSGQQRTDAWSQQRDQTIKLLVAQIVAEGQLTLTPEQRMLAERLISENARLVCQVLAKE